MAFLRVAGFGGLFQVTFVVAATFQLALGLVCLVSAFFAPSAFTLNGAPAQNLGQALTAVTFIVMALLAMNLPISAAGAGLWLLVRRILPKPASVEQVFS